MRRVLRMIGWLFILILLLLLLGPFLIPVPPLENIVAAESLGNQRSQFIDLPLGNNTIKIHSEQAGQGEPALLLLHGFASSTFSWREVIEPLAVDHRVIAFDRPAFGLTERPMRESWGNEADWQTLNPYGPDAQVELTRNLLDQLEIEQAVLVGNSAGGTVAMRMALAYPERVQALILLDPAVYTQSGRSWLRMLAQTPQMQHLAPLFMRRIKTWGREFGKASWHDPSKLTDEIWAGYTNPLQTANWDRGLWEMTLAARPNDLVARLSQLTLPVLVITGDDDRIVPTEQSVRLAGELPNARLVVVPDCGHVPHEECAGVVLEEMERFVKEVISNK